jgi:predicted metal-dependent HD superfamily phosphohydrolase
MPTAQVIAVAIAPAVTADQLDAAAAQLTRDAASMDAARASLAKFRREMRWQGPAAERFAVRFHDTLYRLAYRRNELQSAATACRAAAQATRVMGAPNARSA